MIELSGASIKLTAFHTDPINDPSINEGRHQHTWIITAWKSAEIWFDGRTLKKAVELVVSTFTEGEDIKPEYWAAESMARAVLTLAEVVRVTIDRSEEGFHVDFYRK